MWQVKLPNRDLDVNAKIIFPPQNLNHPPPRILRRRRPVGNLHIHHQTLKIVPLRAPRHLVAQHAIHSSLPLCPQCPLWFEHFQRSES